MKKVFLSALISLSCLTANAQDFGQDKVVNVSTTWTFGQFANKTVTSLEETNGLYLRASEKHSFKGSPSNIKLKLVDGKTMKSEASLATRSRDPKPTAAKVSTAGTAINGNTDCCVAFNAGVAGKVFVAFRTKASDDARTMKIFFKGAKSKDYKEVAKIEAASVKKQKDNLAHLEYTSSESGTFIIGGNCSPSLYAIQFVPAQ